MAYCDIGGRLDIGWQAWNDLAFEIDLEYVRRYACVSSDSKSASARVAALYVKESLAQRVECHGRATERCSTLTECSIGERPTFSS